MIRTRGHLKNCLRPSFASVNPRYFRRGAIRSPMIKERELRNESLAWIRRAFLQFNGKFAVARSSRFMHREVTRHGCRLSFRCLVKKATGSRNRGRSSSTAAINVSRPPARKKRGSAGFFLTIVLHAKKQRRDSDEIASNWSLDLQPMVLNVWLAQSFSK